MHLNIYMCHGTRDGYCALRTTVHGVLADSLLHFFLPRDGRDFVHIQQYVSESVQSCDDSKQLLQGEKQQKFYERGNFIELCVLLLYNPYGLFLHIFCEIILFNFSCSCHTIS